MITGLRLGNFKAFSDTQKIPIKPITLIFGANSAGKSSLIHGFLLVHQAMEKGELDVYETTIGGQSVDLGGFKQYVYNRDLARQVEWMIDLDATVFKGRLGEIFKTARKVTVGITVGLGFKKEFLEKFGETTINTMLKDAEELQYSDFLEIIKKLREEKGETFGQDDQLDKYKKQYFTIKDFLELQQVPQIRTYHIEVDDLPLMKMSARRGGALQLDVLNTEHSVFKAVLSAILLLSTTTDKITDRDFDELKTPIDELVTSVSAEITNFLPRAIKTAEQSGLLDSSSLIPVSKGNRQEDLKGAIKIYLPRILNEIFGGIADAVEGQLKRLHYLGPLRSYPPRHLLHSQYHDQNWRAGGGYAWEEVRKDSVLREKINKWLGDSQKLSTNYELVVQHLLTIDNLEKHYTKQVDAIEQAFANEELGETKEGGTFISGDLFGEISGILSNLKNIESNLTDVRELVLRDKRTETIVSHRDVGIGISQVLPVLVSAYANKGDVIAIEQPEIHLHPALQAELGDVFIQSALGEQKNTFIIETHSEHLLLRIMRRMRETASNKITQDGFKITPDDVVVLFVEPDGTKSIVREMPLNEKGELVKAWPGGFFEEGLREVF